jgi:hypothetical protein
MRPAGHLPSIGRSESAENRLKGAEPLPVRVGLEVGAKLFFELICPLKPARDIEPGLSVRELLVGRVQSGREQLQGRAHVGRDIPEIGDRQAVADHEAQTAHIAMMAEAEIV